MSQKRQIKYNLKNFVKKNLFFAEMATDLVWFVQNNHYSFKEIVLSNPTVAEFVYNKPQRKVYFKSVYNASSKKYDVYICGYYIPFLFFPRFVLTYTEVIKSYTEKEFRNKFVFLK